MSEEKIKTKDFTSFEGPVNTGDPHAKRPADKKKVGDMEPDESVAKSEKHGANLGEEITSLFDGVDGLSEDFVTKATTIFEGAVSEKLEVIKEEIEAEYQAKLDEEVTAISEDLENKLDEYLSLFVEQYMEDNKVAIESGFRNEIAEQVISSMVQIVESAGLELPEDKIDIADALAEENTELTSKANSYLEENISLKKQLRKFQIDEAFNAKTTDLTEASKDRLRKLTENMEFANVEQFTEKLEILKESIAEKSAAVVKPTLSEVSDEPVKPAVVQDTRMQAYINATKGGYNI